MMANALTREIGTRRSAVGDAALDLLGERMSGRPSAGAAAKFREMDEATAQAAADNTATAYRTLGTPGAMGQGAARRNIQTTLQGNAQQVAANKLKQAQMLGQEQDSALAAGLGVESSEQQLQKSYLDSAMRNAGDIGDATTAGALQRVYAQRGGIDYTDEANRRMADVSAGAAADEAAMRQSLEEDRRRRASASRPNKAGNFIAGLAGGAGAGSAFGPVGSAIGAGSGGLLSLL